MWIVWKTERILSYVDRLALDGDGQHVIHDAANWSLAMNVVNCEHCCYNPAGFGYLASYGFWDR